MPKKLNLLDKKIFENITRNIFRNIRKNFICLLTSGSIQLEQVLPNWSDLDFIVVVKRLNLITKIKLNKLFKKIEKDYRTKVGAVVISIEELTKSQILAQRLEGKVLQALVELQKNRQKIYFVQKFSKRIFCPIFDKRQIRMFSLNLSPGIYSS